MKKLFLAINFTAFFISCTFENQPEYSSISSIPFSETVHLETATVQPNLLNVEHLENINNRFLVAGSSKTNPYFHIFELPSLSYLYSWGNRGGGPDEFFNISFNSINSSEDQLILYRPEFNDLQFYSVSETSLELEKSITEISHNKMPLNFLNHLNDSLYITVSMSDFENEYVALKPGSAEPLFSFGNYPHDKFKGARRLQEFYKSTTVKPDGSKIAVFYLFHNLVKIFDDNGAALKKFQINDVETEKSVNESFIYRTAAYSTDQYIYVLAPHIPASKAAVPESIKPFFEIWSWEGEQIKRVELDRFITRFVVSEEHGKVYASSDFENPIYEFSIPGLPSH